MTDILTSLHGRKLGLGRQNQLISNAIEVSRPCVDADITVGAQSSNDRTITIQLKDAYGDDIDYTEMVELYVFTSSARVAFATTGGTTGLAAGTDGALLATVDKKAFVLTSETDGDIDLTWTDTSTGAETVSIGLRLPNGRFINTAAFANT